MLDTSFLHHAQIVQRRQPTMRSTSERGVWLAGGGGGRSPRHTRSSSPPSGHMCFHPGSRCLTSESSIWPVRFDDRPRSLEDSEESAVVLAARAFH